MKSYIAYGISIVVIVLSVIFIYILPLSSDFRALFSLPGITGLFSLLVQGWRDQVSHERAKELQQKQHEFELSVASHMANVVFDKQVEFCEKYYQKMQDVLFSLSSFAFGEVGDRGKGYAKDLQNIRRIYSPWISRALEDNLIVFEDALREISLGSQISTLNSDSPEEKEQIERMTKPALKTYINFMGLQWLSDNKAEGRDVSIAILEHLKDTLGVTDLEILRRDSLRRARKNMDGDSKA